MYTIDNALQDFMTHNERKNLSPETLRYYRENVSRFIAWLNENRICKPSKISSDVINDYMLFLLRNIPNRTSVNTYMRAVRRFANYLIAQKVIKPFVVSLVKDPYKIKPTFDNEEVELILSSVTPSDETSMIMLVLLSTGIRSRSLCNLHVCDINFADKYIDLHITKSGSPLCPPISDTVSRCLRDYVKSFELKNSDYLFSNRWENQLNKDSLVERINKRLRTLGIQKTGVHIFRHTFGKIMSLKGCPTAVLQKWLGHTDIKITQRYTDLYCNELRNTINILPTSSFEYV